MKRKILWVGLSFLLVASLVLASCAEAVPGEQEEEEEEEEDEIKVLGFPRRETIFIRNIAGIMLAPDNFNIWVEGVTGYLHGMNVTAIEALWLSNYGIAEIINAAATGPAEYNEDFTQVTFRIREGMYWSDGEEITADDLEFTLELIRDVEGLKYHIPMQVVEDVVVIDRYTALIKLTEPNARFHTYFMDLVGALYIMPKHVFEEVARPGEEAEGEVNLLTFEFNPPVTQGAYVMHSYDPAGGWSAWVRRDDWERTPTGTLYGKPGPKYVVYIAYGDPTAQVLAHIANELDISFVTKDAAAAIKSANPYALSWRAEFPFHVPHMHVGGGIIFNTLKPPFDNPDVRWALTLAIDIVSLIATAYDGGIGMSALALPNLELMYEQYYTPMEPWLKNFSLEIEPGEYFKPWDPTAPARLMQYVEATGYEIPEDTDVIFGVGWWKYAPDIAARLLEKHGFTRDNNDMWLLPDGTPWKFTILTVVDPAMPPFPGAFAALLEWAKFGIDVTVETSAVITELALVGDFDTLAYWPYGFAISEHPDIFPILDDMLTESHEPELGKRTWGHLSRWGNPDLDELIWELQATGWDDVEETVRIGREALKFLVEYMPATIFWTSMTSMSWNNYWWTGWPSAENPYMVVYHNWSSFKYVLPFLKPALR